MVFWFLCEGIRRLIWTVPCVKRFLLLHGTDISNVEGIARFGLLPGGGSVTNRVAVRWIEHATGGAQPGLRSGSTALVTTKVGTLRNAGIVLYRGSESVILTEAVPPDRAPVGDLRLGL